VSQQDDDPIQPKTCPECCKNDRTVDATDRQIAADAARIALGKEPRRPTGEKNTG